MKIAGILICFVLAFVAGHYGLKFYTKGNDYCLSLACHARDIYRNTGIVLIIVALGFLVLGIVATERKIKSGIQKKKSTE